MKAAIVGFGKMGRAIYAVLSLRNHGIEGVIDPFSKDERVSGKEITEEMLKSVDCVIDFSSPECAVDNIKAYIDSGVAAVIGTTGWLDRLDEVALFLKLVRKAGELYGKVSGYDMAVEEIHHNEKKDSPSGTALMIANALLDTVDRKKTLVLGNSEGKIGEDQLQVTSMRVGRVPGVHTVLIDSEVDTITLTHSARSRNGFALGAVMAAEWLKDTERRGILTLDDYLNETFGE